MNEINEQNKTGWNAECHVYHCSDGIHNSWWATIVRSDEWQVWEKEQEKRMSRGDTEGVFDISESAECGWMSPEHWHAFSTFIKQL